MSFFLCNDGMSYYHLNHNHPGGVILKHHQRDSIHGSKILESRSLVATKGADNKPQQIKSRCRKIKEEKE